MSSWRDSARTLPRARRELLLDRGSLTARLLRASGGDFHVELLRQDWRRPQADEARLLGINPRATAMVREVALHCCGQPWVYARSVIPASSLRGRLRQLRHLQNRSLGQLLFNDPSMRRQPFELTTLRADSAHLPAALRAGGHLWGRRCRFEIGGQPLLVSEFFLAACRA